MKIKYRIYDTELKEYFEPTYEAYKGNLKNLTISMSGELSERTLEYCSKHESMFKGRYITELSTGFYTNKKEIYQGDILSYLVETDEGIKKSKQQVFWNQTTGSWNLDISFKQDKTSSLELWLELNDYEFEIIGNIHQYKHLLK